MTLGGVADTLRAHFMPPIQILPSLLAADMGALAAECARAEAAGSDGLHIDVMDGHFVHNLSYGPDIVKMAKKACRLRLSVHLMVTHPQFLASAFLDAGSDLLMIQIEAHSPPLPILRAIRERGRKAGIVLNPETPLEAIMPVLDSVDEVLFMTVHPGFGGQAFIPTVLPKIKALRAQKPELDISVDGGITMSSAVQCAAAGANALIAGTSLYRAADMKAEVAAMRNAAQAAATA